MFNINDSGYNYFTHEKKKINKKQGGKKKIFAIYISLRGKNEKNYINYFIKFTNIKFVKYTQLGKRKRTI